MTDSRPPDRGKSSRRRLSPAAIGPLILAGIALLLVIGLILFGREQPPERPAEEAVVEAAAEEEEQAPDRSCASQIAYDLIKRELFRRAAEIRGSDQQAFEQLAGYSALRVDTPVVTQRDESLGMVSCRLLVALDLPPGVAVAGGRRTLTASIDYSLQSGVDGSGGVLTLGNVEAITVPLATLARTARPADEPEPGDALPQLNLPMPEPSPAPGPPPQISVSPSFDCRFARTRGEVAVCNDPGLAALDRQLAVTYSRAYGQADERQRDLLQQTRGRFLAYRDRCRTDSCIADAYRGRMREIADIMAGRWRLDR